MASVIDLIGQTYGRLTVLRRVENNRYGCSQWECKCTCGTVTVGIGKELRNGHKQSCGCYGREQRLKASTTHGHGGKRNRSRTYRIWSGMITRCHNLSWHHYHDYGGRGIKVCDNWRHSFEAFLADMGECPSPHLSIDRFPDGNGNYEPGNCRWGTRAEQDRNKPRHNRMVTIDGVTKCFKDWADLFGVRADTAYARVHRGWDDIEALTFPIGSRRTTRSPHRN